MTNQEVARTYANGTGTQGTNPAGSLYWSHDTIYSYGYHHVIARVDRASKTAKVSRYKASVTTSKQTTLVISELTRAGYMVECVEHIPTGQPADTYYYSMPH